MATLRTLPQRAPALRRPLLLPQQKRHFLPPFPNPFGASNSSSSSSSNSGPQTVSATRTLPYATPAIYAIIADVPRYSTFLPYCQHSGVTRWSRPDGRTGARWPAEATLTVGWNALREDFASRVYCAPPDGQQQSEGVVEAVAGASRSRFRPQDVPHHDLPAEGEAGPAGALLSHLLTRWSVKPVNAGAGAGAGSEHSSQVSLHIEFAFANPLYQAMSAAATPLVAGKMIEAFEQRVEEVLGGGAVGAGKVDVAKEGSR